jgi:DNA ligase D-like protein (predicted ligase)
MATNVDEASRSPLERLDSDERARLARREPEFVSPMLATLTDRYFSDPEWIFERKLDGVRAVVVHGPGSRGVRLYSRNQKSMSATYPELVRALTARTAPGLVADGEIVAFDGAQTSFSRLQARIGLTDPKRAEAVGVPVFLYLFDLLILEGHDLTRLPLRVRKRLLREAVDFTDPLRFSTHRNADGEDYLREACASGWEGLIAKRADSSYRPGKRSDGWLKFKCVHQQELVIGGWTEPSGSRSGLGALLVGFYEGPTLRYAGKVGTGFDRRTLADLRTRLDERAAQDSPFDEPIRERAAHWVRPELVAEVGFAEWTRDHRLRHPRFLGLRLDKCPEEVVREAP